MSPAHPPLCKFWGYTWPRKIRNHSRLELYWFWKVINGLLFRNVKNISWAILTVFASSASWTD